MAELREEMKNNPILLKNNFVDEQSNLAAKIIDEKEDTNKQEKDWQKIETGKFLGN